MFFVAATSAAPIGFWDQSQFQFFPPLVGTGLNQSELDWTSLIWVNLVWYSLIYQSEQVESSPNQSDQSKAVWICLTQQNQSEPVGKVKTQTEPV